MRKRLGSNALGLASAALLCGLLGSPRSAEAQIYPATDGMFLCPSPIIAGRFWNDLNAAGSTGVKLTHAVGADIAARNGCRFLQSKKLKPVRFVAGELGVSDGVVLGWTAPELFIVYINGGSAGVR